MFLWVTNRPYSEVGGHVIDIMMLCRLLLTACAVVRSQCVRNQTIAIFSHSCKYNLKVLELDLKYTLRVLRRPRGKRRHRNLRHRVRKRVRPADLPELDLVLSAGCLGEDQQTAAQLVLARLDGDSGPGLGVRGRACRVLDDGPVAGGVGRDGRQHGLAVEDLDAGLHPALGARECDEEAALVELLGANGGG